MTTTEHNLFLTEDYHGQKAACACGGWQLTHVDQATATSILDAHHLHVTSSENPVPWWAEMATLLVTLNEAIQYSAGLDGRITLNTTLVRAARDLLTQAHDELEAGRKEAAQKRSCNCTVPEGLVIGEGGLTPPPGTAQAMQADEPSEDEPADIPDSAQPEDAIPVPVVFTVNGRGTFATCSDCGYVIKNDDDLGSRCSYHLETHHSDREGPEFLMIPENLQPKVEG